MSMIACRECNKQISSQATQCPGCGAAVKKKSGTGKKILFVFLALFGLGTISILMTPPRTRGTAPAASNAPAAQAQNGTTPVPQAAASNAVASMTSEAVPSSNWQYQTEVDKMRNEETRFASTNSSNTLDFQFPYNGGSRTTLSVRQSPKFGFDIYIDISKGQFLCGFDGCSINAKFDDQPVKRWRVVEPSDNSSDTLFIQDDKKFLAELKKAKKLVIEAEFFQEGARQIEFDDISGLEWK